MCSHFVLRLKMFHLPDRLLWCDVGVVPMSHPGVEFQPRFGSGRENLQLACSPLSLGDIDLKCADGKRERDKKTSNSLPFSPLVASTCSMRKLEMRCYGLEGEI